MDIEKVASSPSFQQSLYLGCIQFNKCQTSHFHILETMQLDWLGFRWQQMAAHRIVDFNLDVVEVADDIGVLEHPRINGERMLAVG